MTLIPFNQELNRLILKASNVKAGRSYKVTWGSESRTFTADQLERGINLAAEFPGNPFCAAFAKVDAAVAAKQAYETRQIKQVFRSPEAKTDMEGVAAARRRNASRWLRPSRLPSCLSRTRSRSSRRSSGLYASCPKLGVEFGMSPDPNPYPDVILVTSGDCPHIARDAHRP